MSQMSDSAFALGGNAEMLRDRHDAYRLLEKLGASERLLQHVRQVGEAADRLMRAYQQLGIVFDATMIELGAAMHDAGKILYPEELDGPGARHEPSGQTLLLAHDVPLEITRCCVSHGTWNRVEVSFEERTVALADMLCRGARELRLEQSIVAMAADRLSTDRQSIHEELNRTFERIATANLGYA
ncbi:MAG: hypothetical protein LBV45_05130 [Xanthomonadaceae bacterium]|nr:hypothetical protein [Xanthomonadaceae bacterium]